MSAKFTGFPFRVVCSTANISNQLGLSYVRIFTVPYSIDTIEEVEGAIRSGQLMVIDWGMARQFSPNGTMGIESSKGLGTPGYKVNTTQMPVYNHSDHYRRLIPDTFAKVWFVKDDVLHATNDRLVASERCFEMFFQNTSVSLSLLKSVPPSRLSHSSWNAGSRANHGSVIIWEIARSRVRYLQHGSHAVCSSDRKRGVHVEPS